MGLCPQMRSEKCLEGSDPLMPASRRGSLEPVPGSGGAPDVAKSGQGWVHGQLGNGKVASIYERNDGSLWKVWSQCARSCIQPNVTRETVHAALTTQMKFFLSDHHTLSFLLTLSYKRKKSRLPFFFCIQITIYPIWGKRANLVFFEVKYSANILPAFLHFSNKVTEAADWSKGWVSPL